MAKSVLCTKCENWAHGICTKIKRVIPRLAMHFDCSKCKEIMEERRIQLRSCAMKWSQ